MFTASAEIRPLLAASVQSRRRPGASVSTHRPEAIRDRAQAYLAGSIEPVAEPGTFRSVDVIPDYAACALFVDLSGIPLPSGRRGCRQQHGIGQDDGTGVLGTAAGLPALPIRSIRSTSTSTAAFNHGPTRSRPANIVDLQGGRRRTWVPIWVSPSTAMPTAASWWTR
jgi:hypothetical protein